MSFKLMSHTLHSYFPFPFSSLKAPPSPSSQPNSFPNIFLAFPALSLSPPSFLHLLRHLPSLASTRHLHAAQDQSLWTAFEPQQARVVLLPQAQRVCLPHEQRLDFDLRNRFQDRDRALGTARLERRLEVLVLSDWLVLPIRVDLARRKRHLGCAPQATMLLIC
jgi:hypothetical protein